MDFLLLCDEVGRADPGGRPGVGPEGGPWVLGGSRGWTLGPGVDPEGGLWVLGGSRGWTLGPGVDPEGGPWSCGGFRGRTLGLEWVQTYEPESGRTCGFRRRSSVDRNEKQQHTDG